MTAARSYKEITASMTDAVDRHRAEDKERAIALSRRLVELEAAMIRAGDREALTRLAVALRWEAVLDALWDEEWMRLRPLPAPNPDTARLDLDACDDQVDERYEELLAALKRRRLGRGKR